MAEIQGIEFEIRGNAESASKSLQAFADNLKKANTAASGKGLQALATTLKDISDSLRGVDANGISHLANALNSIKGKPTTLKNIAEYLKQISQIKFDNLTGFTAAMQSIPSKLPETSGKATASATVGTTEPSHKFADFYAKVKEMPSLWKDIQRAQEAASDGVKVDSLQNWMETWSPLKTLAGTVLQPIGAALANLEEQFNQSGVTIGDWFRGLASSERTAGENATPLVYSLDSLRLGMVGIGNAALNAVKGIARFAAELGGKLLSGIWNVTKGLAKMAWNLAKTPFTSAIAGAKSFASKIAQIGSSFKRILFYRLIRTAIKEIGEALDEGTKNAYNFSKQFGVTTKYISEAYDKLSGASFKMGNQMGAAWATLYATIAPIIESIIALITRAMQVISQFLSALGGRSTYLKAIDYTKDWADEAKRGAGSAKEWKNQLMGFDEINRLEEPSKGGGGGGNPYEDYNNMFDEADIEAKIVDFVGRIKEKINEGDWYGAGALLAGKIMSIFPSSEQWDAWGTKLGLYLNGAIQFLYGALDNISFEDIGARLATFLNSAFENIDFTYLGALLVKKSTAQIDFWIGGLSTLDWGLAGKSIGDFFRGALDEATAWTREKDWSEMGHTLYQKFKDLIEGIDFASLAESFFSFLGTAFRAIVDFLDSFLSDAWADIKDYFKQKTEECGGDSWEGFKKGIEDAVVGIGTWIKTHVIDPFINAFKEPLGIHSPSTVFADIGDNVAQGLWNGVKDGIKSAFSAVKTFVDENIIQPFTDALGGMFTIDWSGVFSGLIGWAQSAHAWIQDVLNGLDLLGMKNSSPAEWNSRLPAEFRAEGGFVNTGEIFVARENGIPEMVGHIGSRTAVANNDQITAAIADAVYGAIVSAMPQGGSNTPVVIYMDGKEIARTTTKYQTQFARANG